MAPSIRIRALKLAAFILLSGTATAATAADALTVYTVNYPLAYFATRIGKEHVHVEFPAPAEIDPAFWQPDTETVLAYQAADLILLNGAGYAKWVNKVSLPRSKVVETSGAFADDLIAVDAGPTHSHGPSGEHSHTGTAFTTWLDLRQAIQQAEAVKTALARRHPEAQAELEENFESLKADLLELDQRLATISATKPGQPLVASHPIYQYLARRYALNIVELTWEPDVVPDDRQLGELKTVLASHAAKWMIWEAEPNPESVKLLEQLGVRSLVFDPAANTPPSLDFLRTMERNASQLAQAFP